MVEVPLDKCFALTWATVTCYYVPFYPVNGKSVVTMPLQHVTYRKQRVPYESEIDRSILYNQYHALLGVA